MNWITTSGMLIRELQRMPDEFITILGEDGREYVISGIRMMPNYTDSPSAHICLMMRDGGQCEIKR